MEKLAFILVGILFGVLLHGIVSMLVQYYTEKNKENTSKDNFIKKDNKFKVGSYYAWGLSTDPFSRDMLDTIIYVNDVKPNKDGEIYVQYCYCEFDKFTERITKRKTLYSNTARYLSDTYEWLSDSDTIN